MSSSIKLPQWGMSMSEGTVSEWLVSEGDTVEADQDLVEIEAAKVTNTIPSPLAGTVGRLQVPEGETVEVNTVLCEIYAPGEDPGADGGDDPATAVAEVVTAGGPATAEDLPVGGPEQPRGTVDRTEGVPAGGGSGASPSSTDGIPRDADAARAQSGRITGVVPLARKVAKEHGVDLRTVTGSGTHGRIVVRDVEAAMARTAPAPTAPAPIAPTAPAAAAPRPAAGSDRSRPMSTMRKVIGERMSASLREGAQLTLTTTADVTDFAQLRASVAAGARKPSYVDAVVRASALALREHPGVNARLDGESVVESGTVSIGVAVAVTDGLVVPVVRDADRLGLADLGARVRELAEAARAGSLTPDDYAGGTFSVTSLGGQGIDAFTPILNPPESAILGVGRSREVPLRFGDGIAWRYEMTLSLTIDHRVVDGYPGALFLQEVVRLLEHPTGLL